MSIKSAIIVYELNIANNCFMLIIAKKKFIKNDYSQREKNLKTQKLRYFNCQIFKAYNYKLIKLSNK